MQSDTRVLIVDDEEENVLYLSTILDENGFRDVHAANDGNQALVRAAELAPDLIILDIRIPKKSGILVFNELKEDPALADIPVIILTGEGEFLRHLDSLRSFHEERSLYSEEPTDQVLERFIKARPEIFLEKPIEPEAFMEAVRSVLAARA